VGIAQQRRDTRIECMRHAMQCGIWLPVTGSKSIQSGDFAVASQRIFLRTFALKTALHSSRAVNPEFGVFPYGIRAHQKRAP
jgi:hypothetical protein